VRPVRLEIEGFTVFRQPVVVDFADADLFALVGPTGAGKTSLIDAITFALYGSVPRLDDRRAVAPIVSQNLTEARVRLDFAVGDTTYTAVRVVRATKTGATTKEARLQRGDEVLAGNADEVGEAVVGLLGLTYEHFTTCVSLPQGQFARFLHDKPRDRQDLLVRLLDLGVYDKVASAARQRAMVAANRVDVLGGQLERLASATAAAQVEAEQRVAALAALAETMAAARPELDLLVERAQAARKDAGKQREHLARLQALRAPSGVAELSERLAGTPDWGRQFDLVDQLLLRWSEDGPAPDPAVSWAWDQLERSTGRTPVGLLAEEIGWSRRHFAARFREQVGLAPKPTARVVRFQWAADRLLRAKVGTTITDVAMASGYADHSHMTREFQSLAGLTPSAFVASHLAEGQGLATTFDD
jgi:AraC-like DNA-binding protein